MNALTGRFIGSGSPCLVTEPISQNGIERTKINKKNFEGDFSDNAFMLML
jgi:NOL1/NOP2/fmu family ribosome biogenesis protein